MSKLGDTLRKIREQKGYTQQDIADKMGVYRPVISMIESGGRRVTTEELISFADVYHVSVLDILDRREIPMPKFRFPQDIVLPLLLKKLGGATQMSLPEDMTPDERARVVNYLMVPGVKSTFSKNVLVLSLEEEPNEATPIPKDTSHG